MLKITSIIIILAVAGNYISVPVNQSKKKIKKIRKLL